MKKYRIACIGAVLACSVIGSALASSVEVTRTLRKVTFTVENTYSYTLICDGTLTAKTKSGKFLEAKMKKVSVMPGAMREIFINASNDSDPFVDGWSDIKCMGQ